MEIQGTGKELGAIGRAWKAMPWELKILIAVVVLLFVTAYVVKAFKGEKPVAIATSNIYVSPATSSKESEQHSQSPDAQTVLLSFADSPLLTEGTRERIRRDLTNFRGYFSDLALTVPASGPTIGIANPRTILGPVDMAAPVGRWQEHASFFMETGSRYEVHQYVSREPSPDRDHVLLLVPEDIHDRRAVLLLYAMYVISRKIDPINPDPDGTYASMRAAAISAGSTYFCSSFLGDPCHGVLGDSRIPHVFWQSRARIGKYFADHLMAYTIRSFGESPRRTVKASPDAYFYSRIKEAADAFNGEQSLKIVEKFWTDAGLSTD